MHIKLIMERFFEKDESSEEMKEDFFLYKRKQSRANASTNSIFMYRKIRKVWKL